MQLNLSIYTPSAYVLPSKAEKYESQYGSDMGNTFFKQADREQGIRRLMSINLLKRLESSVYSFHLTLTRIKENISSTINAINEFNANRGKVLDLVEIDDSDDFDLDDQNTDLFSVGKKVKIDLADMDYISWQNELKKDKETLELLDFMISEITPEHDTKLQILFEIIGKKLEAPLNAGNKKVIIFTAFSDTAEYLYENVSKYIKRKYSLDTAMITGSVDGRTTIPKFRATLNNVLTCFSPISKDKNLLMPNSKDAIDILIATDCISEGQNLQDCDYLVNYDIHWNPVRIIQRFGRIDRIGSKNEVIQLVNFWPDLSLDEYINLKSRIESRMRISVMTSTGDDDLINVDEKGDLEYRKQQLKRLQEEVVDIEDMTSGISIMDLGLNEFRMDLLAYIKDNPDINKAPFGLHTVVEGEKPGVIFILKNVNAKVNIESKNRLHQFYLVYISNDGEIISNHLEPKQTLDILRHISKGRTEPDMAACRAFNNDTNDGKNMEQISTLLEKSIASIIDVTEQSDIDSFFGDGETTALTNKISGLDDFELICFVVVR
jgi:hypothetical protein